MTRILSIVVLACCLVCFGGDVPGYDKARYERMETVILQSTNLLAGVSLSDASRLLSLEGIRWDAGYTTVPLGQERIYHFPGFCLRLALEVRPPGIALGSTQSFSYAGEAQLRSNGVWWVSHSWPHLEIDRLNNPQIRMSNYWDNLRMNYRWHQAKTKSIEDKTQKEPKR